MATPSCRRSQILACRRSQILACRRTENIPDLWQLPVAVDPKFWLAVDPKFWLAVGLGISLTYGNSQLP